MYRTARNDDLDVWGSLLAISVVLVLFGGLLTFWQARWSYTYQFGEPVTVRIAGQCTTRYVLGSGNVQHARTTCPDSFWTVGGRQRHGTLTGPFSSIVATGAPLAHVDTVAAKASGGHAYAKPPRTEQVLGIAAPIVLLIAVVAGAVAFRRSR